jgi:hypothetical protein
MPMNEKQIARLCGLVLSGLLTAGLDQFDTTTRASGYPVA